MPLDYTMLRYTIQYTKKRLLRRYYEVHNADAAACCDAVQISRRMLSKRTAMMRVDTILMNEYPVCSVHVWLLCSLVLIDVSVACE